MWHDPWVPRWQRSDELCSRSTPVSVRKVDRPGRDGGRYGPGMNGDVLGDFSWDEYYNDSDYNDYMVIYEY